MEDEFSVNFRGHMAPRSTALQHPAATLHMQFATQICEVICGQACTKTEMALTVNIVPHPSSRTPDTMAAF